MPSLTIESSSVMAIEGIIGPGGANRMVIVTGVARFPGLALSSTEYTAIVPPEFEPGQFRRATATAASSAFGEVVPIAGTAPPAPALEIGAVDADFDDETGRVKLMITARGRGSPMPAVSYQIIIFAAIEAEGASG